MWSGVDLRPRNLFDRTPFYPYSRPRRRPSGARHATGAAAEGDSPTAARHRNGRRAAIARSAEVRTLGGRRCDRCRARSAEMRGG